MPPKKKMGTENTHLLWMDDEVQLSSEATKDFKAKQAHVRVNWESMKQKHEKIRFIDALVIPPSLALLFYTTKILVLFWFLLTIVSIV